MQQETRAAKVAGRVDKAGKADSKAKVSKGKVNKARAVSKVVRVDRNRAGKVDLSRAERAVRNKAVKADLKVKADPSRAKAAISRGTVKARRAKAARRTVVRSSVLATVMAAAIKTVGQD